jgi:hypothetical protein
MEAWGVLRMASDRGGSGRLSGRLPNVEVIARNTKRTRIEWLGLVKAAKDASDKRNRKHAIYGLWPCPTAKDIGRTWLPTLLQAIPDEDVGRSAIKALVGMGYNDTEACPDDHNEARITALREAANDKDVEKDSRMICYMALCELRGDDFVEDAKEVLKGNSQSAKYALIKALQQVRKAPPKLAGLIAKFSEHLAKSGGGEFEAKLLSRCRKAAEHLRSLGA